METRSAGFDGSGESVNKKENKEVLEIINVNKKNKYAPPELEFSSPKMSISSSSSAGGFCTTGCETFMQY